MQNIETRKVNISIPGSPYRLPLVHTIAILFFMFTLSQRWFLTAVPYDCIYVPFLIVSGPLVYFFAHVLQHQSESLFRPDQVMIAWNLVPGTFCLVFGGVQWWLIERYFTSRSSARVATKQ